LITLLSVLCTGVQRGSSQHCSPSRLSLGYAAASSRCCDGLHGDASLPDFILLELASVASVATVALIELRGNPGTIVPPDECSVAAHFMIVSTKIPFSHGAYIF
jgi:hypothetical protein